MSTSESVPSHKPFSGFGPSQPAVLSAIFLVAMVIVLLLATETRFHMLGTQSLWNDEGSSYVQATRSFKAIAEHASRDIHPPGYYWLLAIWMKLVGDTEFALRALSAFASVLSVAFTYALGVRAFDRVAGLPAATFVALNTFSIYYAQETRMYALLALLGVISMWVFLGCVKYPSWRWAVVLGVVNAAGLYTQYAFPFVMFTQAVLLALWIGAHVWQDTGRPMSVETVRSLISRSVRSRLLLYYVFASAVTLLLYSPWISTAWRQVTTWPSTGQPILPAEALNRIIAYFAYGITVGSGTTIMVVYFLAFGMLVLPGSRNREWWWVALPVLWVTVTIVAFLAMGLFREANLKLLLPAQIAFAVWLGRGVSTLWRVKPRRTDLPVFRAVPKAAAALGSFALVVGIWDGLDDLYHSLDYQRDDYRAIVANMQEDLQPGDAVILAAPNQQEVFGYYYSADAPIYALPRGLGGDDSATLAETREVLASYRRIFAVLWGLEERDPNNIVENTLDSEAFEIDSTWFENVRLVRYVTPIEFDSFHEAGIRFGESITLERFALSAETVCPGDVIQLQVVWSADSPLDTRFKVFVQLLDAEGVLVAQRDAEPGGGQYPTTGWQPEESIVDNHALFIPKDLRPANYRLIIGLYDIHDPEDRLLLSDSEPGSDYATIATITVITD